MVAYQAGDLSAFDGQLVDLRLRGTDDFGQPTDVHFDVFVERSPRLRLPAHYLNNALKQAFESVTEIGCSYDNCLIVN